MKSETRAGVVHPRLPKHLPVAPEIKLEDHAELVEMLLSGADLHAARASHVLFEQVVLRGVTFFQSRMSGLRLLDSRLEKCDLSGADWEKARLRRVELAGCRLLGTQWSEASLEDVRFSDCGAEGAVFSLTQFKAVRFEQCMLRGASFEGADLSGVVFDRCDLTDVNLQGARLAGADLHTARIDGLRVGPKDLQGAVIAREQAAQVVGLLGLVIYTGDENGL